MSHEAMIHLLGSLGVILLAAKIGGHIAIQLKQPPVLGELLFGILLGNLHWVQIGPAIELLAELGVILLLFEVGLHSNIQEMKRVGLSALLVATLGVVAPMVLGFGVAVWLLPGHSIYVHLFIGAALCATSVGITARVLSDLNRAHTNEAKIILGAAAIDDVMGLVILAAVSGVIVSADLGVEMSWISIMWIVGKALLFFVGAAALGPFISQKIVLLGARLQGKSTLLTVALALCFFLSALASLAGLAPIVGAFAAGLILEEVHFKAYREWRDHPLGDQLAPLLNFLVPIFFVLMGLRVDLSTFGESSTLGLAVMLTIAAILGKQVCGLGVMTKGINRLAIGIGMIPRGEVGLIFANIGLSLVVRGEHVVTPTIFSAVVFMVMITTLIAPPFLSWALEGDKSA